jgi:tetratricopeptide (TPR) repeat protein
VERISIKGEEIMSDLEAEHQKELVIKRFKMRIILTEAIRLNPKQVTYYCNRSASLAKTKVYYHAMEDALKCVDMSPSFVKGYYRLAIAFDGLNFLKFAIISLQTALKYEPKNSDILTKFQEIYWKLVHQRNVIGKELLRSCRLSQWSFIPTLFCRSTIIRISDRDINDPYYYDDYASPRYAFSLPYGGVCLRHF